MRFGRGAVGQVFGVVLLCVDALHQGRPVIDLDDLESKAGEAKWFMLSHMRGHITNMDRVMEICKTHGVSEQSFYRWRNRFGAMAVSDVRRLRQLEKENGRLKRLLAERELEIDAMKEVVGRDF